MTRRSLRPHLNQIRTWVRQGRTDAWIAHQLEVTVQQIEAFKREQELEPDARGNGAADTTTVDLRAEDDEAIAAELEAEAQRKAEEEAKARRGGGRRGREAAAEERRRPRTAAAKPAAGRRRVAPPQGRRRPLEGTFDHGDEGYGLWLDPAVADDPVYAEHWAGHRPVEVTIEEDQIVITPHRRERRGERRGLTAARPRSGCTARRAGTMAIVRHLLGGPGAGPAAALALRARGTGFGASDVEDFAGPRRLIVAWLTRGTLTRATEDARRGWPRAPRHRPHACPDDGRRRLDRNSGDAATRRARGSKTPRCCRPDRAR